MTSDLRLGRAKRIRELYATGHTANELAKLYCISTDYVYHILANRVQCDPLYKPMRRPKLRDYVDEIAALREDGKTYPEIAVQLGMTLRNKPYSENAIRLALRQSQRCNLN
jgi:DNA-binding CsgD family transcriptional regulator